MDVVFNSYATNNGSASDRPMQTDAIRRFLLAKAPADLAALYSHDMECQVLVARDGGTILKGEFRGKEYQAYTDGHQRWKSFRIPYKAGSVPEYNDKTISYDLEEHADAIGMTGWNWKEGKSIYVAFDFDSIVNHSQGLTESELHEVIQKASDIPWITVRRSTSGIGYHLYVFLDPVETANHHEHAALARSILSKMSALTGFDFQSKVDICGGNMWVWGRKYEETKTSAANRIGFELVKQGEILTDIPPNWRAHIKVAKKQSMRVDLDLPGVELDDLDDVLNERSIVSLDDDHVKLIKALEGTDSWWDADHHLLVTHTWSLKQAHIGLGLKGVFDTVSTGTGTGQDRNCFCIPRRKGAWIVRRYQQVLECPPWYIDAHGFSCCHFNRDPDLRTLATSFGAIETEKRGYLFQSTKEIAEILQHLGAPVVLPEEIRRESTLREDKDGKIVIKIKREPMDSASTFPGFEPNKDGNWTKIIRNASRTSDDLETNQYDHLCRHLITADGSEAGWVINTDQKFISEPLTHIRIALAAKGFSSNEITNMTGGAVLSPWRLVTVPFDREYPGDRKWNRDAPQLLYSLNEDRDALYYPTWLKVLNHCGAGLDAAVQTDLWCMDNGIDTGADYLKCWCASLFQEPDQPLPYLFFYGPQNSGKSVFHEALELLFRPGYIKADNVLTNGQGFNGELQNAVLCVVEETDLSSHRTAYNKIKDLVTSTTLAIRPLYQTTFMVRNTTHWIQCANDSKFCPIIPGDTRVVIIEVAELTEIIPKKTLMDSLKLEASDFLTELLRMSIPHSPDRLNIPPLRTESKDLLEEQNRNEFQIFLNDHCYYVPGEYVTLNELHSVFLGTLQNTSLANRWSKIRLGRELPSKFVKGRHSNATHIVGNISFNPDPRPDLPMNVRPQWRRQPGTDFLILA